jgi:hypothetical protein
MRRRRGTLSKMTAVTRGPSSRSGQALETHTKFLQPQHQPAIPILAACHFAPASLTSTISGSSLWNGTGEMQRWKLAEQIATGVLGGGGPWSNGAQATSRPHLRMSLWFRSVETWASLSGHRPPDAVLLYIPCHAAHQGTAHPFGDRGEVPNQRHRQPAPVSEPNSRIGTLRNGPMFASAVGSRDSQYLFPAAVLSLVPTVSQA